MSNYTPTGNPQTISRATSPQIRAEFQAVANAIQTKGEASDVALKANKAGETFTGTHDFTGATVAVATQANTDNSTKPASTAFVRNMISGGVIGASATIRETQTAGSSQTVFNLTNPYTPNTNSIAVYINGVRQFPGTFTETSAQVVTFSAELIAGDSVMFEIGVITSGTSTSAAAVAFTPPSGLTSTNVQQALVEVAQRYTPFIASLYGAL